MPRPGAAVRGTLVGDDAAVGPGVDTAVSAPVDPAVRYEVGDVLDTPDSAAVGPAVDCPADAGVIAPR
ncbi:hypothetical protein [Micromonospora sp. NPDC049679]|uniref:hypothetical protein n=1 Tax=Micromonospora sp. NPDC049679 TaxID=3155920 RepID=UPI0033D52DCE